MDEIVVRVRAGDGDRSPLDPARTTLRAGATRRGPLGRAHGRPDLPAARDRPLCRGMGTRTREPRAEGLSALIAIETLRTLALRTMAELGAREEPVPTEDLARLALALHRIESADKLRIEREQAAADAAAAHAGPAARAASMTHAERVETVRRALEGHLFPGGTDPPPPAIPGGPRPLPRTPTSPRRTPRPSRLPTTGRRMRGAQAGRRMCWTRAGRAIRGTRTGRGMPS